MITVPPYPFFIYSGDALYRPGDFHRKRSGLECFDLLFVEYGSLYMKVENNAYHVKANHMLIMPSGKEHESYKVCDEKTCFHWLHFNPAGSFQISDTFNSDFITQHTLANKKNATEMLVLPVFKALAAMDASNVTQIMAGLESFRVNRYLQSSLTLKEGNYYTSLQRQKVFLDLLSYINLAEESLNSKEIAPMLMQYLQSNYTTKISLHDMAKIANCHPTHIIRCFNKRYGTTPAKALIHIRLQQAKRLLESTELSCEKIANEVGFSSSSYFSKAFREYYGVSPNEHRKGQRTPGEGEIYANTLFASS